MTSLTDLASAKTAIPELKGLEVQGLSAEAIATLFTVEPELKKIVVGRPADEDLTTYLLGQSPFILAHIVAAACGKPGVKTEVEAARNLPVGSTALIITECIKLSFPQSINSFMTSLTALLEGAGLNVAGLIKEVDTKSPAPSKGVSAAA